MGVREALLRQRGTPGKARTFRHAGVEWHCRLVTKVTEFRDGDRPVKRVSQSGLLDLVPSSELARGFLVCWEMPKQDGAGASVAKSAVLPVSALGDFRAKQFAGPKRLFAFFRSFLDFLEFQDGIPPADRTFFEIILGGKPQKPHFDIDVAAADVPAVAAFARAPLTLDDVGRLLVEGVVAAAIAVAARAEPPAALSADADFAVYSSHGPEKRSFHVVCPTVCHADNDDARAFAQLVLQAPEIGALAGFPDLHRLVDQSVYAKKQQFRLLGSSKSGAARPKVPLDPFPFAGRLVSRRKPPAANAAHARNLEFAESLVSFTADSRPLPRFAALAPPRPAFEPSGDLSEAQISQALALCAKVCGPGFELERASGGALFLRRLEPSFCPLCRRTHHSDNPFLVVRESHNSGAPSRSVLWCCRRAPPGGKGMLDLGSVAAEAALAPAADAEEFSEGVFFSVDGEREVLRPAGSPHPHAPGSSFPPACASAFPPASGSACPPPPARGPAAIADPPLASSVLPSSYPAVSLPAGGGKSRISTVKPQSALDAARSVAEALRASQPPPKPRAKMLVSECTDEVVFRHLPADSPGAALASDRAAKTAAEEKRERAIPANAPQLKM